MVAPPTAVVNALSRGPGAPCLHRHALV